MRADSRKNRAAGHAPGKVPALIFSALAGGCFWGMEEILRQESGIAETVVD